MGFLLRETLRGSTVAGLDLLSQTEASPNAAVNQPADAPDQLEEITHALAGMAGN